MFLFSKNQVLYFHLAYFVEKSKGSEMKVDNFAIIKRNVKPNKFLLLQVGPNCLKISFLAITSNGENVLNADYEISSSFGTKYFKGHVIKYERSDKLNQIQIDGPLTVPMQFQV